MFTGILYDAARPPADQHFKLSREALESLAAQLNGIPIRIEHTTADEQPRLNRLRNVGKVTRAWFDGSVLGVDWVLDDTTAGWSSERLIETGVAPELSLQHAVFGDGSVQPVEVSLVRKGARDGCAILAAPYKCSEQPGSIQPTLVMASAAADVPPPAVAAAEPVAEAAPPAAAPMATDEPSAKRKRFDTPMDFVNDIQSKITDTATLQTVLDYIGETIESNVAVQNEVKTLREAKELLEQSQKAHVESSKNVVRDIVDALSAMYQNFGAISMDGAHKDKLATLLSENVEAREALRPILVAASAISNLRAAAATANSNAAVQAAAEKISKLSQQLMAGRNMTSAAVQPVAAPAVAPQWMQPAPVAAVAASAHAQQQQQEPKFVVPDILRGPSYTEVGGVGRVTRDHFSRKM